MRVGGRRHRGAGHRDRRPRQRAGRRGAGAHGERAWHGEHPGQQRGRRIRLTAARDHRERLGCAVQVEPAPCAALHPAGITAFGEGGPAGKHHQRDVHRGRTGGARLRGVRGRQGRRHQLHQDGGARTGHPGHSGQRAGPRPDRHRRAAAGIARRAARQRRAHDPDGNGRGTSTKWPVRRSFSPPTCPATSPGRRSTSTAERRPPAGGTTTRRPATISWVPASLSAAGCPGRDRPAWPRSLPTHRHRCPAHCGTRHGGRGTAAPTERRAAAGTRFHPIRSLISSSMAGHEWCWNASASCARAVSIQSVRNQPSSSFGSPGRPSGSTPGTRVPAIAERHPSAAACASRRRRSAGSRLRRRRWWPPRTRPTSRTSTV